MKKGALETSRATKAVWLIKKRYRFIRNAIFNRLYVSAENEKAIVDNFHKLYWESVNFGRGIGNVKWRGVEIAKYPTDLWVYQEILNEIKPDVIIEAGTYKGGSALYLADMCDLP